MKTYILYGAGANGVRILNLLGKDNVLCFVDEKQNRGVLEVENTPVISPNQLKAYYGEKNKIIITPCSKRMSYEISVELEKLYISDYIFSDEIEDLEKEEKELPIIEYPEYKRKEDFWDINSQFGEDSILDKIFSTIGFRGRCAVEFGAWDGIYLSNIKYIAEKHNLKRIYIEGDEEKYVQGKANYTDSQDVIFINEYVGLGEKYKLLDDILKANNVKENLDIISIDIDGYDYWVWESMTKYRPRVVVIEYNPTTANDVVMIPPHHELMGIGASPKAIIQLAKEKHYELVEVTVCNLIFIVEEEFSKLGISDNSLDTLRPEKSYCSMLPITDYTGRLLHSNYGGL